MIQQIRDTWKLLPRPGRLFLCFVGFLQVTVAAMEVSAIGLIFLFLTSLLEKTPTALSESALLKSIAEGLFSGEPAKAYAVLALIVFTARTLLAILASALQNRLIAYLYNTIASRLMSSYLSGSYIDHLSRNSGEITNNVTTNVTNVVAYCVIGMLEIFASIVMLSIFTAGLLLTQPFMTLSLISIILIFLLLYILTMKGWLKSRSEAARKASATLFAEVNQTFLGFKVIKIDAAEVFFMDLFRTSATRLTGLLTALNFSKDIPRFTLESIGVGGVLILVIFALHDTMSGNELVVLLATFGLVFLRAMPHAVRLVSYLQLFVVGQPLLKKVIADLGDPNLNVHMRQAATGSRQTPAADWCSLVLSDVQFAYRPEESVLKGINLAIHQGELVAFVGPSGSGKTTAVDILTGLVQPDRGHVLLDGGIVNPATWASEVPFFAYVPQEPFIMDAPLLENIVFAAPKAQLRMNDYEACIDRANLRHVANRLGTSSLGERGNRLSGGERQRLGIARALYRDARVLVLDEPTASQDAANEAELMTTLRALRGRKTVVVIAHRITALREFDRIHLFGNGRIEISGTYEELVASSEHFRKMVEHFSSSSTTALQAELPR